MIRILLAEDHAVVRAGLRQILALDSELQIIGEAEHSQQVFEFLQTHTADLILLDLNMPGRSGSDMVKQIRSKWAKLPILVLTMHNEPQIATAVLRAGANGFVTKDSELDVLLPAIRAVASGGKYLCPGMAEKIVFYETPATGEAPHLLLTVREAQIFNMLKQGMRNNAIAESLALSSKTVSTHKIRILQKLTCESVADLIRYCNRHGLLG